jgi:hypothetical protein
VEVSARIKLESHGAGRDHSISPMIPTLNLDAYSFWKMVMNFQTIDLCIHLSGGQLRRFENLLVHPKALSLQGIL